MKIYILTNPELGWDNVVSASTTKVGCIASYTDHEVLLQSEEEADKWVDSNDMVLHEETLFIPEK
jgi:hypothetical protein